jgi:hypothetical protein
VFKIQPDLSRNNAALFFTLRPLAGIGPSPSGHPRCMSDCGTWLSDSESSLSEPGAWYCDIHARNFEFDEPKSECGARLSELDAPGTMIEPPPAATNRSFEKITAESALQNIAQKLCRRSPARFGCNHKRGSRCQGGCRVRPCFGYLLSAQRP